MQNVLQTSCRMVSALLACAVAPCVWLIASQSMSILVARMQAHVLRPILFDDPLGPWGTSVWVDGMYRSAVYRGVGVIGDPSADVFLAIKLVLADPSRLATTVVTYSAVWALSLCALLGWSRLSHHRCGLGRLPATAEVEPYSSMEWISKLMFKAATAVLPIWALLATVASLILWIASVCLSEGWVQARFERLWTPSGASLSSVEFGLSVSLRVAPYVLMAWTFAHGLVAIRITVNRRLAESPNRCRCGYDAVDFICPECGRSWSWISRTRWPRWLSVRRFRVIRRGAWCLFPILIATLILAQAVSADIFVMRSAAAMRILNPVQQERWQGRGEIQRVIFVRNGTDVVLESGPTRVLMRVMPKTSGDVSLGFDLLAVSTSARNRDEVQVARWVVGQNPEIRLSMIPATVYIAPGSSDESSAMSFVRVLAVSSRPFSLARRGQGDPTDGEAALMLDEVWTSLAR